MRIASVLVCAATVAVSTAFPHSLSGFIHDVEEGVEKVGDFMEELGLTIKSGLGYLNFDPPPPVPSVVPSSSTAEWMTEMKADLAHIPLNKLVLPGSHDSGTFAITAHSAYANDEPSLNKLSGLPSWLGGDLATKIISLWARTQVADWTTQLEAGARYLDIRVCNMGSELMICHGLQAGKVYDMIDAVAAFHRAHPGEIIIVDFNHFYGMDDTQHTALIQKIQTAFGDSMAQKSSLRIDSPAQSFSDSPLLISYSDEAYASKFPFLYNNIIYGPWADTPSISELRAFLVDAIRKRPKDQIFKLQGIRTETARVVVDGLLEPGSHPTSLVRLEQVTSMDFVSWVRNSWADCNLNILMVDDFGLYDVVGLARELNKRGPLANPKVLDAPPQRKSADSVPEPADADVWADLERKYREDVGVLDLIRANVDDALAHDLHDHAQPSQADSESSRAQGVRDRLARMEIV